MASPNPKMQGALTEYLGWVFTGLMKRTGEKNAELCKRVFREWVEHNEERLARWDLSPDAWRQETGGNIAQMELERKLRRSKKETRGPVDRTPK